MRFIVLTVAAVLALGLTGASQSAATTTKTVSILSTGFSPTTRTIATGDVIKWTNKDTKEHQVVANNGSFASAVIQPGKSYSHTFNTAGTFRYHDALHPTLTGRIIVNGPPPAVTIAAAVPILAYGQSTHISGAVSSKKAGETVTLWAQPYGTASMAQIATVLTTTDGVWDFIVKPTLLTTYQAHWKAAVSQAVGVQLRPAVSFGATKRFGNVQVKANHSLQGKKVYLQKFTRFHEWVKVRPIILGPGSRKMGFLLGLPGGQRYAVRIFMSLNQVGAGYLDGFSPTRVVSVPRLKR
jgi:plastocyanin